MLLLDITLTTRMIDHVTSVEKPSGSGLKLDLDRLRRDLDEAVRLAKKGADELVSSAKEALAEAQGALAQAGAAEKLELSSRAGSWRFGETHGATIAIMAGNP